MIRIFSSIRFLKYTNLYNKASFATSRKIKDDDQLSFDELENLLGRTLSEQQKAKSIAKVSEPNLVEKKQSTQLSEKTYFYGLMPLKNQNYPECIDPTFVELEETPNQNIFRQLGLATNCSFFDYTSALSKYRTEVDLYGDESQKEVIQNNSLQFKQLLHPESKYLQFTRGKQMVNISIPGSIQLEDSRNFLQLRPVQQFRHTPLVPISDSYMKKHQEMLERYHRKQFVFEVKTESIINWVLVGVSLGIGGYMLYLILQKQQERTVNFSRLKYQRLMGESTEKPIFKI